METTSGLMGVFVRSRVGLATANPAGSRADDLTGTCGCRAASTVEAAGAGVVVSDWPRILAGLGAWLAREMVVSAVEAGVAVGLAGAWISAFPEPAGAVGMETTAGLMEVFVWSRVGLATADPAGSRADERIGTWGCWAASTVEAAGAELVGSNRPRILAGLGAWLARKKAVSAAGAFGGLADATVPGAAGRAKRKVVSAAAHTPPIA
jgi:hypothetical protein